MINNLVYARIAKLLIRKNNATSLQNSTILHSRCISELYDLYPVRIKSRTVNISPTHHAPHHKYTRGAALLPYPEPLSFCCHLVALTLIPLLACQVVRVSIEIGTISGPVNIQAQ